MPFRRKKKRKPFEIPDSQKTLHKNLDFTGSEQYKMLRTNLSFTLPDDVKCPIIGITSSMRGEGKSTTAINLAHALAENKKKVLLIDGDLRIPSIAKKMRIRGRPGLTDLLFGVEGITLESFKSNILDNWYVMPSGTLPPNPSELLGSKKMQRLLDTLTEKLDYIIIDLPPVNVVSDALTLSGLITGMVLVVREDYTSKKELSTCIRQMKLAKVNVLGCVMNAAKSGMGSYGKYKKYYKSYKS